MKTRATGLTWRARCVLALVLSAVLALGGWIAQRGAQAVMKAAPAVAADGVPNVFAAHLAGQRLSVDAEPGFQLRTLPFGTVLQHDGEAIGSSGVVDLCQQRKRSAAAPFSIYGVVVARWLDIADGRAHARLGVSGELRSPVVLPAALATHAPLVYIHGEARDFSGGEGVLHMRLAESPRGGRWTVVSDLLDGSQPRRSGEGEARLTFSRQAWVLWRAPESSGRTDSDAYAMKLERRGNPAVRCALVGKTPPDSPGALHVSLYKLGRGGPERYVAVALQDGRTVLEGRLPVGEHHFPARYEPVEDQRLFEQLQALGLLRVVDDDSERIEFAPRDLLRAQALGVSTAGWPNFEGQVRAEAERLLARLYHKADGRYVRAQVERYNSTREWAALRFRSQDECVQAILQRAQRGLWQGQQNGTLLVLSEDMPAVGARLFDILPAAWTPWLRVKDWPAASLQEGQSPQADFVLAPAVVGWSEGEFEVLALGELEVVEGAELLEARAGCRGPGCPHPGTLTHARLRLESGAQTLRLRVKADTDFNALAVGQTEALEVGVEEGVPRWYPRHQARAVASAPVGEDASVTVLAADGQVLYANGGPTELAVKLGLLPVVGIGAEHRESVAGALHASARVEARLTVESGIQGLAHRILDCIALQAGAWQAESASCVEGVQPELAPPADRRAAMVLLDADSGEIVSAVSLPAPPAGVLTAEALAFHRFNPGASPLLQGAWQHDGSARHAPGSTFKIVTALGLEQVAGRNRRIESLLAGSSREQGFSLSSPCYPSCNVRTTISNFNHYPPSRYAKGGSFGLHEALTHSVNTWFAFMTEQTDRTLSAPVNRFGLPLAIGDALDEARPTIEVAHQLGFGVAHRLDGGLFGDTLPADSVLRATASGFDPLHDQHQLRMHANGLRSQVTPVQMAMVAAAVATGQVRTAHVLRSVDGVESALGPASGLEPRLDRIRAAMKAVVVEGTASTAFSANATRRALRPAFFGKTGTAECRGCEEPNLAWFIGYFDTPERRYAFAVRIQSTRKGDTGGRLAAEVIAALGESLVWQGAMPLNR